MKYLTAVTHNKYADTVSIGFEFGGRDGHIMTLARGQSKEDVIQNLRLLADAIEAQIYKQIDQHLHNAADLYPEYRES